MPNLRVTQGSSIVNGSSETSVIESGLFNGLICTASLVGATPTSYAWVLTCPSGSASSLSLATVATPTFVPDVSGVYFLSLNGTYTLPLLVTATLPSSYLGPVVPGNLLQSQVPVPAQGSAITSDASNIGSLRVTDANGNHNPLAIVRSGTTGQRPTSPLIGLYPGFLYFDITLGKPIWRNAANSGWVDATGVVA